MRRKWRSLILALLLCVTLFGCGTQSEKTKTTDKEGNGGRYVEEEIILPISISGPNISELTFLNGIPAYLDIRNNFIFHMNEKKNSFTAESFRIANEMMAYDYSVTKDERIWIIYELPENYVEDKPSEILLSCSHDKGENWNTFSLGHDYYFYGNSVELAGDGNIYAVLCPSTGNTCNEICKINIKTGKMESVIQLNTNGNCSLDVVGDNLVIVSDKKIIMYDYVTNEKREVSKTLMDFVNQEEFGVQPELGDMNFDICAGEEGTMYIACASGLYRYVIGGERVEQVLDGLTCHLGNPSWKITSVLMENDSSFLVAFSNGKIMRYYYDKAAGNAYDSKLTIFSFVSNETAMNTINEFQSLYPNVEITYETANTNDYQSAMKELEELIASDTPPDVIVTDGMDVESLKKNNIVESLTEYENSIFANKDVLLNIVQPDKENWYTMPCLYQIPYMAGNEEDLKEDYTEFLELLKEKYEQSEVDFNAISTYDDGEEMLDGALLLAWEDMYKDGTLTEEELANVFEACNRLYNAELVSSPVYMKGTIDNCANYLLFTQYPFVGRINNILDLMNVNTLSKTNNKTSYRLKKQYVPVCKLSICTKAKNHDNAVRFLEIALSDNVQGIESQDGLPVNKKILESYVNRPYASLYAQKEGDYLYLPSKQKTARVNNLTKNEINTFITTVESMTEKIDADSQFYKIYLQYGKKCLKGEVDAKAAAKGAFEEIKEVQSNEK